MLCVGMASGTSSCTQSNLTGVSTCLHPPPPFTPLQAHTAAKGARHAANKASSAAAAAADKVKGGAKGAADTAANLGATAGDVAGGWGGDTRVTVVTWQATGS